MNESEARQILGVSELATFKDIKKSHRALVNIYHPDRAGADGSSQHRSNEAMSRINQAWDVIQKLESQGVLGLSQSQIPTHQVQGNWNYSPRRPNAHECELCGSTPARRWIIKGFATYILSFQRMGYEGILCQSCAMAFARDALRVTMMRGWWGMWFFFTPITIISILSKLRDIRLMSPPEYRDIRVISPYELPVMAQKNPFKQLKPLMVMAVGIIAVTVFFTMPSGSRTNQTPINTPSSTSLNLRSCFTATDKDGQVLAVPCTDPTAFYQELSKVVDLTDCPANSVGTLDKDSLGYYTCLELKT